MTVLGRVSLYLKKIDGDYKEDNAQLVRPSSEK